MFYTYVLRSKKDNKSYTDWCENLERRLGEHNQCLVKATLGRRPLYLIYYEACLDKKVLLSERSISKVVQEELFYIEEWGP